jgi:hypothetical protein
LRTPDEVAEIRGLSVNQVLGLTTEPEVATETVSGAPVPASSNGDGASADEEATASEPEESSEA